MEAYINKIIPIPSAKLKLVAGPFPKVIADSRETLSGRRRNDVAYIRHEWQFKTSRLTRDEWELIVNHIGALFGGETFWWHSDLGGTADANSIYAKVTTDANDFAAFGADATWESSGRNLVLTVRQTRATTS